jgi:mRNA interferase MazF
MQPIKRGEVWWVSFDPSVGGEIRKTRPAVVVSNNAANMALNRVVVIPLTSQTGRVYPSEVVVTIGGRPAKAMANQIMTASKVCLRKRIGALTYEDIGAVEKAILFHLAIRT